MFNTKSRTRNAFVSTAWGLTYRISSVVFSFVYRTIFLLILSEEFLGLNNLFSSVLGVLSLAELGIGSAINYRLYKPVAEKDVESVAAYMDFYKKVYAIIIAVIAVLGFALLPALPYFIKDIDQVSNLINVKVAYSLYIVQVLSGYIFVDRQGLLYADQRGYIISIASMITHILQIILQIVMLVITKDYMYTIVVCIIATLSVNLGLAIWIKHQYKDVFEIKKKLPKEEVKLVFKDTYALLCHRIGGTISGSVDNILISSFIGLAIGGLYSNYTIIITALNLLTSQILTTFMGSIGNLKLTSSVDHEFEVYKRLLFLNFTIASFCVMELFNLFNPFIEVWIGPSYKLSMLVVFAITLNFYLNINRQINITTIVAVGLFNKDKWRPIVEAGINLVVSIGLIYLFGVDDIFAPIYEQIGIYGKENMQLLGILLGTTISVLVLPFWRDVRLLFKFEYKRNQSYFYKKYLIFFIFSIVCTIIGYFSVFKIPNTWGFWFLKAIILLVEFIILYLIAFARTDNFKYYFNLVQGTCNKVIFKIKHRGKKGENNIEQNEEQLAKEKEILKSLEDDDSEGNEDVR